MYKKNVRKDKCFKNFEQGHHVHTNIYFECKLDSQNLTKVCENAGTTKILHCTCILEITCVSASSVFYFCIFIYLLHTLTLNHPKKLRVFLKKRPGIDRVAVL